MRVLHIGLSSVKGGIESFALSYMKELGKQSVIFDFVDIYGVGLVSEDEIKASGGRIYTLSNLKKHPLRHLKQLRACIQDNGYTCVHIHVQSEINFLPLMAARLAGVTPVMHVHFSSPNSLTRRLVFALTKHIFRSIPSYRFACTEDAGNWFWGKRSFAVIPNAVDIDKFSFSVQNRSTLRAQLGIEDGTLVLGYVGRFEPVKNPLFSLEILACLKQRYPHKKVTLLTLGVGSLLKHFQSQAGADVICLGYKPNVSAYLSAMDVFLMPSLHEGLSVAAVEAQTNGLVCLFSDTIPRKNQILPSGGFYSLEAPAAWADAIGALTVQTEAQRLTGREAIEKTNYNISVSGKQLLDIYKRSE